MMTIVGVWTDLFYERVDSNQVDGSNIIRHTRKN